MDSKPRCYVASPLGFSEAGRHYYAEVLLPTLEKLVTPVDPWALVSEDEIVAAAKLGNEEEFAREIGQRNFKALKSCELLVAVLDGQEIDSGTASEIGFAAANKLPCFGLRTDHRKSGEPGATINLQVEAFILMSDGRIVGSLAELVAELRRFLNGSAASSKGSARAERVAS